VTSLKTWAGYVGAGLVLLFAVGAVGWFWGRSELRKDIALAPRDTVHSVQTDTVHLHEIAYRNLPARIDTVRDTTVMMQERVVASIDTIMAVHEDTLKIEYVFPPANVFNIDFRPGPVPVMVKTETVTKTVIETETSIPWLIGAVTTGIVAGIIIDKRMK